MTNKKITEKQYNAYRSARRKEIAFGLVALAIVILMASSFIVAMSASYRIAIADEITFTFGIGIMMQLFIVAVGILAAIRCFFVGSKIEYFSPNGDMIHKWKILEKEGGNEE